MESSNTTNLKTITERTQTQRMKFTLKNGTVKTYTYIRPSKIKEKTKLFDLLNNDENVKNVLKNKTLGSVEKIEKIRDLTQQHDEMKKLTLSQIKNFVYRNL